MRIPNLGEQKFVAFTKEGCQKNIRVQVCDVNKGLLSVSKVTNGGSEVVFDSDGSYIEDKNTGERMYLTERNGMYMLKMWTRRDF